MNLSDIIILALVGTAIVLALRQALRKKGHGGCGSGGCCGCASTSCALRRQDSRTDKEGGTE